MMRWGLLAIVVAALPAAAANLKFTLIATADDPRFERNRLERATLGHAGGPALDGVQVALAEAKVELEASNLKVDLEVVEAKNLVEARAAAAQAERTGVAAVLADLPPTWLLAAVDSVPKLPVINLSDARNSLRQDECRRNLWHVIPSERMRADALAQTLVAHRWTQVLMLTGPTPDDAARAATAQAALQRYGLKLVGARPFKASADPRERELNNTLLLTQGSYDVVWVVDSEGDFAAYLPYRTALPRPVVGDGGLVPLAWSHKFERYGAPQVSRRFQRAAKRPMTAHDWAAWIAGKALVAAAVASARAPQGGGFAQALAAVEVDGSKGVKMSFRPWDGQLRQPVLLSDGQAVIATAPADGVLHPKNTLDTLGADAPEKLCKQR